MSGEELIGKFGAKYKEAKSRLNTLEAEARHYAEELKKIAATLENPPRVDFTMPNSSLQINNYPSQETIQQLVNNIIKTRVEAESSREELKNLGLDVK